MYALWPTWIYANNNKSYLSCTLLVCICRVRPHLMKHQKDKKLILYFLDETCAGITKKNLRARAQFVFFSGEKSRGHLKQNHQLDLPQSMQRNKPCALRSPRRLVMYLNRFEVTRCPSGARGVVWSKNLDELWALRILSNFWVGVHPTQSHPKNYNGRHTAHRSTSHTGYDT